jgi:hypothetical protein
MIICNNVGFIHIPRTGGTSIRHALEWQPFPLYPLGLLTKPHSELSNAANTYNPHEPIHRFAGCPLVKILTVFSVVRNPWDRYVSWYEYHRRDSGSLRTFGEFMETVLGNVQPERDPARPRNPVTQSEYIQHVDAAFEYTLLRFEHLDDDWAAFCEEHGLAASPLAKLNATDRFDRAAYYAGDGERWRDVIAEREAYLIERFGYRF